MKKKIVLGFSGGLDTSYCAKYLSDTLGYEVHSITVNTGGFSEAETRQIQEHAYALGVTSHTTVDAVHDYYNRIVRFLVAGNVLRNGTYPLSVSAERLVQALHIAEHVTRLKATAVAHGSTGAGNDQVRFDLVFRIMIPEAEIVTPIRDLNLQRSAEIDYLKSHAIEMNYQKAEYSINTGLWGTSVGGKETLSSLGMIPDDAWPTPITCTQPQTVQLGFEEGHLTQINGVAYSHPVNAIQALQKLAGPYGIGRDIHIGDTIIGIKGRVAFEAAAPVVIIKAHHTLEKHVLSKDQLLLKDQLAAWYGTWLHDGRILDPVMRDIEAFLVSTQHCVTGTVHVELHPRTFVILGIESPFDLMNTTFGTYGEQNTLWTGEDVRGFTRIMANSGMILQHIKNQNNT
ncbi:MAG: argininosuccinate synthase [Flavobacteriales bacterium]|nr:MAG: argininosuccinate synthase [Chlorobi bacterium OLB6]MBE2266289.1 argininosuccinate synthase [Flavobacteriales bacterium]MBV6462867.1 Argininosuccinate synthase [Chlorobiota bacterium]MBW7853466.1 argininosuccinate synthase [Candidatus Kapabacteria bacterium]MCC6331611.1 argininosuccinate synthase [Ignavibacteria bacterium]